MLLSTKPNKTKAKLLIAVVAVLFVTTPVYFASAEANFLENIFYEMVVFFFGGLTGLCGAVLNYAVQNFVVNFAYEFNSPDLNRVISVLWTLIRDIFNMTFIFGLVYIGFTMILKSDTSSTRKWLINLIIAALLVNFSLLISKLVIDATNLTATQILNAGLNTPRPIFTSDGRQVDFAGSMMDQLGITSIFRKPSEDMRNAENAANLPAVKGDQTFGYSMMLMLVFLITAFVFLSAGIMIIIRGAMLVLFMIFSPLMFLGFVLPSLMGTTKRYWEEFIGKALFAPVYILLVYVGMSIFQAVQVQQGTANGKLGNAFSAEGFGSAQTVASTFGPFALFIVLMVASLTVAKKLGSEGASTAMNIGNNALKRGKKMAVGSSRYVAAQTAGRGARYASEKAGNATARTLRNLQQLQGTNAFTRTIRGVARSNAAQAAVGGAAASMQNAKFGMKTTREQDRNRQNQTNARADRGVNINRNQAPAINAMSNAAEIAARQQARRQQQGEVRDMTNEEILELARQERERVMSPEFASLLSDSQVKAIRDSGILTNAQSDTLEQNRDEGTFAEITEVLNNSNATTDQLTEAMDALNRAMSTMSNDRLAGMMRFDAAGRVTGPLADNAVASRLTSAQIDTLQQTGRASAAQLQQVKDARRDGFITIANNGSLGNPGSPGGGDANFQDRQRRAMFRNPQDAGKLPVQALALAPGYVTPRIVEEFVSNNPSRADMDTLRVSLRAHILANPAEAPQWVNWQNNQSNVMSQRFGNII